MHPILFHEPFFGRPVYAYGFMLGLSFTVGCLLTYVLARRDGYRSRTAILAFCFAVGGALLGARILFFLANPDRFGGIEGFFSYHHGGLVAYGGFFGGLVAAWAYLRLRGEPFLRLADHAAPSMALGLALTRIGCLLAGCDFGRPAGLPWSIRFPQGAPAFEHHRAAGFVPPDAAWSLPVHPTQVYESLCGLALLTLLLLRRDRGGAFRGQAFLAFLGLYSAFRFLCEFFRDDPQRGGLWIFSTSQWLALATCAATLALGLRLASRRGPGGSSPGAAAPR